jgi:hypothetical protein
LCRTILLLMGHLQRSWARLFWSCWVRSTVPLGQLGAAQGDSGVCQCYLAGRNATWIWTATPGAENPSTSLVL